jgi:cell division transport system permease protein
MRASFIAQEASIGLRRNLTLTIAAVVTTAVSLALLGAGLLVRQQASVIDQLYYGKLKVAIFLDPSVTQQERDSLSTRLAHDPEVKAFTYESQAEAYARFKVENAGSDILADASPQDLPESFRVQLVDAHEFEEVRARYATAPGVQKKDPILDYRTILDPIFKLLAGARKLAFTIAIVQVLAAALLIYNTVRVSAFGRRRETGIMRLVGASGLSIQLPFLVEGAVAGLLGGLLSCGALALGKVFIIDGILAQAVHTNVLPELGWNDVFDTMIVLVVVGVVLSGLASFLTLRRFVRV